jgi:hypothetical protein
MADIVKSTRNKVRTYLKTVFGKHYKDIVLEIDDVFVVRRGSAAVHVSVRPMGKTDTLVQAMAYVVQGAKITPRLLNYLMRLNAINQIGAFGLIFDDTITFSHAIAGAHLDANELRKTIGTVAYVADETDDEIRRLAGGKRAVDANAEIMCEDTAAEPAKKKAQAKKAPAKTAKAPVKKTRR